MAEERDCSLLISRTAGSVDCDKNQGYDLDFVNDLDTKYECPICLLCQREPVQTPCGHRFCRSCILTWIRTGRNKCPSDNETIEEETLFLDNFAKREINSLKVRCPCKINGCEEIFELGKIQEHLLSCQFVSILCPNDCSATILRKDLESHLNNECLRRTITCKLCFSGFPLNDQQKHFELCPMVPIPCECGEVLPRQQLDNHKEAVCPKGTISCPFADIGCPVKMQRKLMDEHLTTHMANHLRMAVNKLKDLQLIMGNSLNDRQQDFTVGNNWLDQSQNLGDASPEVGSVKQLDYFVTANNGHMEKYSIVPSGDHIRELFQRNIHLEQKTRELELKFESLRHQLKKSEEQCLTLTSRFENNESRFCNGIHYWKITEFSRLRDEAASGHNRVLHSPGFYTSCYGYKVCLRLNVQGCDDSAFMSLFLHLMQGDYDDILTWPFAGKITMSVIDQYDRTETKRDITETMHTKPGLTAFRKPTTERNPKGFGYTEFVLLKTLFDGPYLKRDTLIVRAMVTI